MGKKEKSRLMGGIMGHAVGDALGVPVEFYSRIELNRSPVTDMQGYGTHQQPPGTWSDDTSLTLATIIGLCDKERLERVADEFINWFDYAAYTPGGCVLDIGSVTKEAIIRLKEGASLQESGGIQIYENGNGSNVIFL